MGIMVYSLSWVMQDVYHQPYPSGFPSKGFLMEAPETPKFLVYAPMRDLLPELS